MVQLRKIAQPTSTEEAIRTSFIDESKEILQSFTEMVTENKMKIFLTSIPL